MEVTFGFYLPGPGKKNHFCPQSDGQHLSCGPNLIARVTGKVGETL